MAGALRGFRHSRRRDNFPGEFIDGAHIDELAALLSLHDGKHVVAEGAQGFVDSGHAIGRRGHLRGILGQWTLLFEPFLAAAVDQLHVLVAVILQLPEGIGGEPVVVVAIEKYGGVVGDAGFAEQFLQRGLVNQIATHVVLQLRLPVPSHRARNMPLIVRRRVDIDLNEPRIRRVQVLRYRFG